MISALGSLIVGNSALSESSSRIARSFRVERGNASDLSEGSMSLRTSIVILRIEELSRDSQGLISRGRTAEKAL